MVRAVNDALVRTAPGFLRLAKVAQNKKDTITALAYPTATATQLCLFRDTILNAARRLDPSVIAVDPTEEWTRIKVHGVDARRYVGRMDVLKRDLMTDNDGLDIPMQVRWLTDESTVRRRLEDGAIRASSVTFAVRDRASAVRATKRGLFLAGQTLTADLYLKAGPDAFCDHCSGWGHLLHACPSKAEAPKCAHCALDHPTSRHRCNIKDCPECAKQPGRICGHTKSALRCPNCEGRHSAKDDACPAKKRAVQKAKSGPKAATRKEPDATKQPEEPRPQTPAQEAPESDSDSDMSDAVDLVHTSAPATPEEPL
jgi:hypothetical protein